MTINLDNIPNGVKDIFWDIAVGIRNSQIMDAQNNINLKDWNKKYKTKTRLPDLINNILEPFLDDLRYDLSWKHEQTFMLIDGTRISVIEYLPFSDACIIKYDNEMPIKVSKKYLSELYSNKVDI